MTAPVNTLLSVMYWQEAFAAGDVRSLLLANIIVATMVMVLTMALAVPAAHYLARQSRLVSYGLILVLFTIRVIPELSTVILDIMPNVWAGVLIDRVLRALPFVLLILIYSFQAVPRSLDEAARVDGASSWQVMRFVALPLARPGVILAAAFVWFETLGEFFYALYLATLKPIVSPMMSTAEQYATWYRSATYVMMLLLFMLLIILIVQEKIRKDSR